MSAAQKENQIMIQTCHGQEEIDFLSFIKNALSTLAEEKYDVYLNMFDNSRISRDELILTLRYLDENRPVIKIDNPSEERPGEQYVIIHQYNNGCGYWMDYDLTTNGQRNDLTIQIEFLKQGTYYFVSLEDLHTL